MPTATESPAEQATTTFNSISPNQVLTRRAERHIDNGLGGKEVLTEGEWFQRMEDKGEDFDRTPWKVEFVNHIFSTEDPTLVSWLRDHKNFNTNAPGGFYEVGAAPDEPKPTRAEQSKRIAKASAALDAVQLTEIIDGECDTHNRPEVIDAAEAALQVILEGPSESEAGAGNGNGAQKSTSPPSQPA